MRVAELVADEVRCSIATARRRLNEYPAIRHWSVASVRAYRDTGNLDALSRFFAPLEAIVADLPVLPIADALHLGSQLDAAEETPVNIYGSNIYGPRRNDEALARAAVRAIDAERIAQLQLRQAIVARHGLL